MNKPPGPKDFSKPFTCDICYETIDPKAPQAEGDIPPSLVLTCQHQFCSACLRESLNFHVQRAEVDKLVCPEVGCKQ